MDQRWVVIITLQQQNQKRVINFPWLTARNSSKLRSCYPTATCRMETVLHLCKTPFLHSVTVIYRFRLHAPVESWGLVICDAWCNRTATVCPQRTLPAVPKLLCCCTSLHMPQTGLSYQHPQAKGRTEKHVFKVHTLLNLIIRGRRVKHIYSRAQNSEAMHFSRNRILISISPPLLKVIHTVTQINTTIINFYDTTELCL